MFSPQVLFLCQQTQSTSERTRPSLILRSLQQTCRSWAAWTNPYITAGTPRMLPEIKTFLINLKFGSFRWLFATACSLWVTGLFRQVVRVWHSTCTWQLSRYATREMCAAVSSVTCLVQPLWRWAVDAALECPPSLKWCAAPEFCRNPIVGPPPLLDLLTVLALFWGVLLLEMDDSEIWSTKSLLFFESTEVLSTPNSLRYLICVKGWPGHSSYYIVVFHHFKRMKKVMLIYKITIFVGWPLHI